MYERYFQPPITRRAFIKRTALHVGIALVIILFSLVMGIVGQMYFEDLPLLDAFLQAATLLGGMGLVRAPVHASTKLFVGIYSLYAGLVFIAAFSIIFAPIMHRVLHQFHWDGDRSGAG